MSIQITCKSLPLHYFTIFNVGVIVIIFLLIYNVTCYLNSSHILFANRSGILAYNNAFRPI